MAGISLCMIVKNEERLLKRCLSSVASVVDEIIIVDTGSTDATKEIAAEFTDKIYDFAWCDDFAAARNYACSLATKEYIYMPDADEYLDACNREKFAVLKEALLPEIEIVQMWYVTPKEYNTVENFRKELRPKLFKRVRSFTWQDPVHETIRTEPVIYDSEIEIIHMPHALHAKRDFALFEKAYRREGRLSEKITRMYARELCKCGEKEDYLRAEEYFSRHYEEHADKESAVILAHMARLCGNVDEFFSVCLKDMATQGCAEICYELGCYYMDKGKEKEASLWFYNAIHETEPVLDVEIPGKKAKERLADCYEKIAGAEPDNSERYLQEAEEYRRAAKNFTLQDDIEKG